MNQSPIQWAVAARPFPGETESGDLHVVAPFEHGALIAVIDGLGHGPEAACASQAAASVLRSSPGAPLVDLAHRCHEALRGTRGAALVLVALSGASGRYSWVGVGNVEAVRYGRAGGASRARDALISTAGVVGYQVAAWKRRDGELKVGDLFILASDGISPRFVERPTTGADLEALTSDILARYARASDDALVLAVRYLGVEP